MKDIARLRNLHSHLGGTNEYHGLSPFPFIITDGVLDFAQAAEAFWFLVIIASLQPIAMKNNDEFEWIQYWTLVKGPAPTKDELQRQGHKILEYIDHSEGPPTPEQMQNYAHVICSLDCEGKQIRIVQNIPFTDYLWEGWARPVIKVGYGDGKRNCGCLLCED